MNVRFAEPLRDNPLDFVGTEGEIAEATIDRPSSHVCQEDIYLGIFFDGTNNNKYRDTPGFSHSNVARLYEAFIGTPAKTAAPTFLDKVSGGKKIKRPVFADEKFQPRGIAADTFSRYRKIYVPGVGTPFPDVGDSGTKKDKDLGLGMAYLGEARLCWAMLQLCNQVHAALTGTPAVATSVDFKTADTPWKYDPFNGAIGRLREDYAQRLNEQIAPLEAALRKAVEQRGNNKPTIRQIRLSVFGFSRGAAKARAFVNMVNRRWGNRLCGLRLSIDFLGVFDTVASVGIAQSVPGANGHFSWAADENMVVPPAVHRCVHLVAAHEVRASFPLDSVCQGEFLPENCKEIVYPGVHSDVGGGYPPNDQGRALGNGAEGDCLKLSQIPLAQMYREARMAGVPLGSQTQLIAYQTRNFKIAPALRNAFNAYVRATRSGSVIPTQGKGDPQFAQTFPTETQPRMALQTIMLQHQAYFLQWRKSVLGRVHTLPGLQKNPLDSRWQDIEDLRGADEELVKELQFLQDPDPKKFSKVDDHTMELAKNGAAAGAPAAGHFVFGPVGAAIGAGAALKVASAIESAMREKQKQWDGFLRSAWAGADQLTGEGAHAAQYLFESHVHDSRAWFKALMAQTRLDSSYAMRPDDEAWFTLGEREKALAEARSGSSEKMTAPRDYDPLLIGGREPYRMYGYLRYRKLYQSGQVANPAAYKKRQTVLDKEEHQRFMDDLGQRSTEQENARHDAEVKRIKDNEQRVIKENRIPASDMRDYLDYSKRSLAEEEARHAANLQDIAARTRQ